MSDDAKMWQDAHARAVAEIARLRSVCRVASDCVGYAMGHITPSTPAWKLLDLVMRDLADAGKEPSDERRSD